MNAGRSAPIGNVCVNFHSWKGTSRLALCPVRLPMASHEIMSFSEWLAARDPGLQLWRGRERILVS
jgi:hypothetical protein